MQNTLNGWTKPASDTEETKLSNAERLVREAISEEDLLTNRKTKTFGQGSYANDTNVRQDSDIDINVLYEGGFYYKIPEGRTKRLARPKKSPERKKAARPSFESCVRLSF